MKKVPEAGVARDGLRIDIPPDKPMETGALYCFMPQLSASLDGRAVMRLDFLPGVTLTLHWLDCVDLARAADLSREHAACASTSKRAALIKAR